jgi:chitinase
MAQGASLWPAKAFAPYVDMTLWPTYDLASAAQSQGIRHFNLAFVVASPTNKAPCWGGQSTYGVDGGEFDTKVRGMVQQVRALGGDVAVSFGGANGQELADAITDPVALKAAYLKVVEAYGLSRIDFDIEGAAVNNRAAIDRRSAVVAQLQADRAAAGKPLEVWFTLPVLPTGLTADGLYVVQSAAKAGVRLGGVNIMAMDYGDSAAPNPSGRMGDYAIQAATATQAQLRQAIPALSDAAAWAMIGVTPMIGLNDVTTEVFDQTEARELLAFAGQKGIGMLSMWSLNRDIQNPNGAISYVEPTSSSIRQTPFEFSRIMLSHESATSNPTPAPTPAPQPSVSIASASVAEGNSGTKSLSFVVSLSQASASPVSVTVNTADGTAKAGQDYQALSASVITIAAGATSATVSVPVIGDTTVEPDETLTVTISAAAGAAIATASATGTIANDDTAATPSPAPTPGSGAAKKRVVGYFAEWGIYGRNYTVADLPVDKLTTINYAFAKITDSGEVAIFDSWAAVEKPFGSDTWDTPLRGNYHQLQLLKAANPNLEIMISVGGWTLSGKFSDVALTDASRAKFAASCLAFCNQYGFDGVDLDWEYPVSGGLSSNTYRPEDKRNYTLLVEEIRRQFNAADALDGKHRLISIAAPAGYDKIINLEPAALAKSLDFMNLMTYDYHGSWENTTNHQAALYGNPADPSAEGSRYTIAATVDAYLAAGVAPEKMVLGAPIYGRSWRGVGPANDGLFQAASGAGAGTWETGSIDYSDLLNKVKTQPSVYQLYWDAAAGVPYVYAPTVDGGWFSTFENTQSLNLKIDYLMSKGLGGIMFWEASGDVRDANSADSLIGTAAKRLI